MTYAQLEKWDVVCGGGRGFGKLRTEPPTEKSVVVHCNDYCSCLAVSKWSDEEEYMIFTYKSTEKSFWYRVKEGFRYIFLKKKIVDTELILTEKAFNKIKQF